MLVVFCITITKENLNELIKEGIFWLEEYFRETSKDTTEYTIEKERNPTDITITLPYEPALNTKIQVFSHLNNKYFVLW